MKIGVFHDFSMDTMIKWSVSDLREACAEAKLDLITDYSHNIGKYKLDVAIFYRPIYDHTFKIKLKQNAKYFALAIDDHVWVNKPGDLFFEMSKLCDFLIFPNRYLADKCDSPLPKVLKDASFTTRNFKILNDAKIFRQKKETFDVFLTKEDVNGDFLGNLSQIINQVNAMKLKKKVVFHGFGNVYRNLPVLQHNKVNGVEAFHRYLASRYPDAILNPLKEDDFNNCKTYIKYLEAGAANAVLITSRTRPFLGVIKDQVNGMFASTPEEYAEKIAMLVNDSELHKNIVENAEADVLTNYSAVESAKKFFSEIEELVPKLPSRNIRVETPVPTLNDYFSTSKSIIDKSKRTIVNPHINREEIGKNINLSELDGYLTKPLKDYIPFKTEFEESLVHVSMPITNLGEIEQTFYYPGDSLSRIDLKIATYGQSFDYAPRYDIYSGRTLIMSGFINQSTIKDNDWCPIIFPKFIPENRNITIKIRNTGGKPFSFYLAKNMLGQSCRANKQNHHPLSMRLYV